MRSLSAPISILLGFLLALAYAQLDLDTEIDRHKTFVYRIKEAYCNFNCQPAYILTRFRANHCRNACKEFYFNPTDAAPPAPSPNRVAAHSPPAGFQPVRIASDPTIDKTANLPLQPLANNFKIQDTQFPQTRQRVALPGFKPAVPKAVGNPAQSIALRSSVGQAPPRLSTGSSSQFAAAAGLVRVPTSQQGVYSIGPRRPSVRLPGVRPPGPPPLRRPNLEPTGQRALVNPSSLRRLPPNWPPAPPALKVCNRPNWQPCVSKEVANQKALACCQAAGLSPQCQTICNYDTSSAQLRQSYISKKCTPGEAEQLLKCGANGRNMEECCQDRGVFSERRDRCRPYCNPSNPHGLPKPSIANLRCFGQFEKIQQCFWASQV